jgi:hypothetical protein
MPSPPAPVCVGGSIVAYRLFDIGDQVALDAALDRLRAGAPDRVRPVRSEAAALIIPNPPVAIVLGHERVVFGEATHDVELSARLFDFGVVSVRVRLPVPPGTPWAAFAALGRTLHAHPAVADLTAQHLRLLLSRIGDAVSRPSMAPVTEDYVVYRVTTLTDDAGTPLPPSVLPNDAIAPLLLNETRPLSADARRDLLPHRSSYFADDLVVVSWENALVVEPVPGDEDVQFILEFANAQLLELRYYDEVLDREMRRMQERVVQARRGGLVGLLARRYASVLGDLQRLMGEATELVERVDNALKVTDDVYLARVYHAALELFRGRAWRAGIDRKLAIVRETYGLLNDEAQAARAEALEVAIVVLILLEIVMALGR